MLLQIFQLTALVKNSVWWNAVQVNYQEIDGASACVQDFDRVPLFTQRNYFSETGITMLRTGATWQDCTSYTWVFIGVCASSVVTDLKACRDKVVLRSKLSRDTRSVCSTSTVWCRLWLLKTLPVLVSENRTSVMRETQVIWLRAIMPVSQVAVGIMVVPGRERRILVQSLRFEINSFCCESLTY